MTFSEMAEAAGIKPKGMYTMREVSIATGIPYTTIRDERACGRIRCFLPKGRKQGFLFKPEWVDEWIDDGSTDSGDQRMGGAHG